MAEKETKRKENFKVRFVIELLLAIAACELFYCLVPRYGLRLDPFNLNINKIDALSRETPLVRIRNIVFIII